MLSFNEDSVGSTNIVCILIPCWCMDNRIWKCLKMKFQMLWISAVVMKTKSHHPIGLRTTVVRSVKIPLLNYHDSAGALKYFKGGW